MIMNILSSVKILALLFVSALGVWQLVKGGQEREREMVDIHTYIGCLLQITQIISLMHLKVLLHVLEI